MSVILSGTFLVYVCTLSNTTNVVIEPTQNSALERGKMVLHLDISSSELKAERKAKGYSQTELAELAGVSRSTVSDWENRRGQLHASIGLFQILDKLGILEGLKRQHAHGRGWGVTNQQAVSQEKTLENEYFWFKEKSKERTNNLRVQCLAKTRKGRPCLLMSEAGRRRCKFHGGMSSGPRTSEGKERIAEAQKLRWRRYRELSV